MVIQTHASTQVAMDNEQASAKMTIGAQSCSGERVFIFFLPGRITYPERQLLIAATGAIVARTWWPPVLAGGQSP